MNAKVTAPDKAANQEIVITRVFNAPRALVFQAWTDPQHLAQWWGPRGFTNPRCEVDVRPGGIMRIDMRAPNGTIYPMSGIYLELTAPEKIVFTSGALDDKGNQIFEFFHTVTFAEKGGKTTLTMRSRVVRTTEEAAKYIGGFEAGMTQSLEKLAGHLAQTGEPLIIERTFNAPAALVWKAITDNEDLGHWYFKLAEFKPEAGFEFQFTGDCEGGKYLHRCQITEVVPGKKIAYTWRYEGHEGGSLVTFELFAEADRTRLKLTHEGLETFPKTPEFDRGRFNEGWTTIIGKGLKEFVESKFAESKPNINQLKIMSTNKAVVQPYLFFEGRCEEAVEFYRQAVGAEVEMLMHFKDSPEPAQCPAGAADKVMHATIRIGQNTIMASDGRCVGKADFKGFALSLTVTAVAEAERLFAALAVGGQVQMPLTKTFFSPSFGMVADRFGVLWMIHVVG